jgi:hypothetical protein
MTQDEGLTEALEHLLHGRGKEAVASASRWPNAWVARCITYLARSFFLFDPIGAAETFGGTEGLIRLSESGTVEWYFLRGFGFCFRRETQAAAEAFESALRIAPDDPFVQFGMAFLQQFGAASKYDAMLHVGRFLAAQAHHPLLGLFEGLTAEAERRKSRT